MTISLRIETAKRTIAIYKDWSFKRLCLKLNARFKRAKKNQDFQLFYRSGGVDAELYLHLVRQELMNWANYPETFSQEDFDFMCERRGFIKAEAQNILDALYFFGYRFNIRVPDSLKDEYPLVGA